MKAEYMRILTIAAVALVTMYVVSHYAGNIAATIGLMPAVTEA